MKPRRPSVMSGFAVSFAWLMVVTTAMTARASGGPEGTWTPGSTAAGAGNLSVSSATPSAAEFAVRAGPTCGGQHRYMALGATFTCSSAVVSFEYARGTPSGGFETLVELRFCRNGRCDHGHAYLTNSLASMRHCFDAPDPVTWGWVSMHEGANVVPIAALDEKVDGRCDGPFDAIEVHVLAHGGDAIDVGSFTLSNLRVSEATAPAAPAPPCPGDLESATIIGDAERGFRHCKATRREESHLERFPMAYVAYGVGGSSTGVRHNLDAAVSYWWWNHSSSNAFVLSADVSTGFGVYPTYVSPEAAWMFGVPFMMDLGISAGPAARVEPRFAAGGTARLEVQLLLMRLGLRGVMMGTSDHDAQLLATIGLGPPLFPVMH